MQKYAYMFENFSQDWTHTVSFLKPQVLFLLGHLVVKSISDWELKLLS